MDYKKSNAPLNTQPHDLIELSQQTGNIYETVSVIARRSNQIAGEMKHDLEKKLQEFATLNDNLEEITENREQIEISRYYEKLPKPTLIATQEYIDENSTSAIRARRRLPSTTEPSPHADLIPATAMPPWILLVLHGSRRLFSPVHLP